MKYSTLFGMMILPVAFAMMACSKTAPIDQRYLQSTQYAEFNHRVTQEARRNSKKNRSLQKFLKQQGRCGSEPLLVVPLVLTLEKITDLAKKMGANCSVEADGQHLQLLGKSRGPHHTIKWVLLQRETVYQDKELIAAAFKDDHLRSFKTVGVFKDNLSEHISSTVHVDTSAEGIRIATETHRQIKYPFEQTNTIQTRYRLDRNGGISEWP